MVERALRLDAIRKASSRNYDYFQILLSIRQRVVKVRGHQGWVAVAERTSAAVGSLEGRLFSGILGLEDADIPRAVLAEVDKGVPRELAGLSIFAFDR